MKDITQISGLKELFDEENFFFKVINKTKAVDAILHIRNPKGLLLYKRHGQDRGDNVFLFTIERSLLNEELSGSRILIQFVLEDGHKGYEVVNL